MQIRLTEMILKYLAKISCDVLLIYIYQKQSSHDE